MTMEDIICVLPNPNVDFSVSTSQVSFGSSEVDFTNNSTNAVDYIWDYGDGTTDSLIFYPVLMSSILMMKNFSL